MRSRASLPDAQKGSDIPLAPIGHDDWADDQERPLWRPSAFPDWLGGDSEAVARRLLGCYLVRDLPDGTNGGNPVRVVVRIVETEAYDQDDPASHAYHGLSHRNRALFGPSGRCYVYFTYGMWHCLNVSCSQDGYGAGALIRAVQPIVGGDLLEKRRGKLATASGKPAPLGQRVQALDGPARLTQALAIDETLYSHDLREPPLRLMDGDLRPGERAVRTIRIGISKAVDRPRRFAIAGNPWVSKMPPATRRLAARLERAEHPSGHSS